MCQVHRGAYVSLLATGNTDYVYRFPPKEDCRVYIAPGTYHYAYAPQTQVKWEKETKRRKDIPIDYPTNLIFYTQQPIFLAEAKTLLK